MTASRDDRRLAALAGLCAATAVAVLATSVLAPAAAEAGARRCWERNDGRVVCRQGRDSVDRRSAQEREWERDRANHYDPTGSYAAYPDWARYALSPKSLR